MEMKNEVTEGENICTALLTAGVVLSMTCLKHFSSVSSLIEQWRSWVFLFLNVVLIAVYFTSTRSSSCEDRELKILPVGRLRNRVKKKAKHVSSDFAVELHKIEKEMKSYVVEEVVEETEEQEKSCFFAKESAQKVEDEERKDDKEDAYIEAGRLSNEELNERVEAFITTFRQHLVLDARRGRDRRNISRRKETETMRSNDNRYNCSNINFSTRQVSCSV